MSEKYKFDRNYLKLLIDNKDKLIEVPINDVRLILTYCEILLNRQDKTIKYIKEHIKYECDIAFNGMQFYSHRLYDFSKKELLETLGDKENE